MPFFTNKPAEFGPIRAKHGDAHLLRDSGNFRKVACNSLVAIDLRLENFPIIDSGLAWLAGIANDEARFEVCGIYLQGFAEFSARAQMNRAHSAKRRRIMILRTGGYVNHHRFGVAADVNPISAAFFRAGELIERGANRHGHGAGAANARACWRFRIRSESESCARLEKSY